MSQGVLTMGNDFQARWMGERLRLDSRGRVRPTLWDACSCCGKAWVPDFLPNWKTAVNVPALLPLQLLFSSWLFCPPPVG